MAREFPWGYPPRGAESNEFQREEFLTYLGNLPLSSLPFSCDNLRVLTEAVHLKRHGAPTLKYKGGTLICLQRVNSGLTNQRCHFETDVVSKAGELEIKCGLSEIKFKITPS